MPDFQTTLLAGSAMGLLAAYLAHRQGRKPLRWFFIGFFFGLLGVIAFFFIPKRKMGTATSESVKPIPQPYLFGPADKFWYYLNETKEQVGPMSHNGITSAWKEGKLSPLTFVWHEELPEWKPLQELVRVRE